MSSDEQQHTVLCISPDSFLISLYFVGKIGNSSSDLLKYVQS